MPVAVRHAGRGADSSLISNSVFVVPPMSLLHPCCLLVICKALPIRFATIGGICVFSRKSAGLASVLGLMLLTPFCAASILSCILLVLPLRLLRCLSAMASILSALMLIMIEQHVAFHALLIALCTCCSSCILGGGALRMLSILLRSLSIWWDASLSHSASTLSLTPYLATWLVLRLLPSGLIRFVLVGLRVLVRLAILGGLLDLLVLGRGSCAAQSGFGDWMLAGFFKFNTCTLATCCCRRLWICVWLFS